MANRDLIKLAFGFLVILELTVLPGCGRTGTQEAAKMDATKIADLQCQSRLFTKQKFSLSNEFTRLDNERIKKQVSAQKADSIQQDLNQKKVKLVNQSQIVSDSLLHFLRQIWKEKYTSKEDRATLDSLTAKELLRVCKLPSP